MKPKTTIRIETGDNAANDLNLDQLDKDDMFDMKSLKGQFMNKNMDSMFGKSNGATFANRNGVTSASEGVLPLSTGAETGMLSLFSGSKIPTGASESYDIPEDNAGTARVRENEFKSKFHGVDGTYTCTGSNCNVKTDQMSKLTLTGAWMFTPTATDLTEIKLPGVDYDSDYLSFGYWVRTTGEGDDTKYGVGTFFGGSQAVGTSTVAVTLGNLVGEATYSGKAAEEDFGSIQSSCVG